MAQSGVITEFSEPIISYTDTVGSSSQQRTLLLPKPSRFTVASRTKRDQNESNSGKVETLSYFSRDRITVAWEMLPLSGNVFAGTVTAPGFIDLKRVWDSTKDGTTFTFTRHRSVSTGGYPGDGRYNAHDNQYTVRFAGSFNAFTFQQVRRVKDRFDVQLTLEEAL